ncbi:MAG: hypothetical protein LBF60_07440, partial [Treponema sp.]|nr:hypothetical protein [Treponema sp.]
TPPPPPPLAENCCVAVISQEMRKELRYCAEIALRATGETAALLAQDDKVFLSYHWYNHDKTVYQWDYPRFHPFAMQEGCFHAVMPLEIPSRPGVYYFQADIVQEQVRWFCGAGLLSSEYREVTVE